MASSTPEAGRLSATRMSDWSPQSPSSEMLLSAAPLCMPPSSCAGWMEPVLLCLSIGEALCLERTSRSWLEWLQGADGVWEQLATECGVRVECVGPLAKYFKVANWRRVCVECLGEISRELRGEASPFDVRRVRRAVWTASRPTLAPSSPTPFSKERA